MGMIITSLGDLGYEHEGYVANVLDDGTVTGTWSAETRPRMTGELRAVCDCGWTGTRTWATDDPEPDGCPSEALTDEIMVEWEAHVHALAEAAGITPTEHVAVDDRKRVDEAVRAFRDASGIAVNTVVDAGPVAAWPFPGDVDDTIAVAAEILPYLRHLLSAAQTRLEGLAHGDARLRTTATAPAGTVALDAAQRLSGIIAALAEQDAALAEVRSLTSTLGYTYLPSTDNEE